MNGDKWMSLYSRNIMVVCCSDVAWDSRAYVVWFRMRHKDLFSRTRDIDGKRSEICRGVPVVTCRNRQADKQTGKRQTKTQRQTHKHIM